MMDIIKPEELQPAQRGEINKQPKRSKAAKRPKWLAPKTGMLSMPLVSELMRTLETAPVLKDRSCIMESGVLAFRREADGATRVLLISKKRTGNWGIPKGRVSRQISFAGTAAKEAFEEAGIVGSISPGSVGMFRATKRVGGSLPQRIIEVWVYLLEVTNTLPDWPEKGKRAIRWVTCDDAARQLREPVLAILPPAGAELVKLAEETSVSISRPLGSSIERAAHPSLARQDDRGDREQDEDAAPECLIAVGDQCRQRGQRDVTHHFSHTDTARWPAERHLE
jgi:8-oxo-dGTP pyrophosphatase MutT (NUDIX family)